MRFMTHNISPHTGVPAGTKIPMDSHQKMFRKMSCIKVDGDAYRTELHEVVEEVPVALFVNGRHAMTAMMSPVQLEEFVTGFLFTEQIIKGVEEIESIRIEKNRISVITRNLFKVLGPKKTILSGCGGSVSFIDAGKLPTIQSNLIITPQKIEESIKTALASDLHRITGGSTSSPCSIAVPSCQCLRISAGIMQLTG